MTLPLLLTDFNEAKRNDKGPVVTLHYSDADTASRAARLLNREIDIAQRGINPRTDAALSRYDADDIAMEVRFAKGRRNRAQRLYGALRENPETHGRLHSWGRDSFRIFAPASVIVAKLLPAAEAAGFTPLVHKGEDAFAEKSAVTHNATSADTQLRFRAPRDWQDNEGRALAETLYTLDRQHLEPKALGIRGLHGYLTGGAKLVFNDAAAQQRGVQTLNEFGWLRPNAHFFAAEIRPEEHTVVLRGPREFFDIAKDLFRHSTETQVRPLSIRQALGL